MLSPIAFDNPDRKLCNVGELFSDEDVKQNTYMINGTILSLDALGTHSPCARQHSTLEKHSPQHRPVQYLPLCQTKKMTTL